jgi:serine phosphatase RsbU (regulator of sigma subunit)
MESIPAGSSDKIPASIIYYVERTKQSLVLSDASTDAKFNQDIYVKANHPKSVLCSPIMQKGVLTGILYLENNLTEGAFTPDRLQIINILSGQAAISIDNAMLYANMEQKVMDRTQELAQANEELGEKNKNITSSIEYSLTIQQAILPAQSVMRENFKDFFLLYRPKDIVAGDFYWFSKRDNLIFIAVADCTGHGVPGALMSMLGISFLNEIVNEYHVFNPAEILDLLRLKVIKTLRQRETNTKDGMDISICVINTEMRELNYAGAFNPVYITSKIKDTASMAFEVYVNEHVPEKYLKILPADRFPVGIVEGQNNDMFTNKKYQYYEGDCLYLFSDGLADQFGGAQGKKYKTKQLKDLLLKVSRYEMDLQQLSISEEFENWKGVHEQVDDILIIGIKMA